MQWQDASHTRSHSRVVGDRSVPCHGHGDGGAVAGPQLPSPPPVQVVRGVSLPAAPQSAPPPTQLAQQPLDPTTQKRTAEGTPEGGVPNNTGNTGPPIGTTQHHQQQQQPQGCAHHPYQGLQQTGKAEEALLHLGNPRVDELMSHILPRVTSTPFMVIPRSV